MVYAGKCSCIVLRIERDELRTYDAERTDRSTRERRNASTIIC
jgi:hypothetical protein